MAGVIGDEWVIGGERVGEEYRAVERVGGARIDAVGREEDGDYDEGVDPCVPEGEGFPPSEEGFCFPSLGKWTEGFDLGVALGGGLIS